MCASCTLFLHFCSPKDFSCPLYLPNFDTGNAIAGRFECLFTLCTCKISDFVHLQILMQRNWKLKHKFSKILNNFLKYSWTKYHACLHSFECTLQAKLKCDVIKQNSQIPILRYSQKKQMISCFQLLLEPSNCPSLQTNRPILMGSVCKGSFKNDVSLNWKVKIEFNQLKTHFA